MSMIMDKLQAVALEALTSALQSCSPQQQAIFRRIFGEPETISPLRRFAAARFLDQFLNKVQLLENPLEAAKLEYFAPGTLVGNPKFPGVWIVCGHVGGETIVTQMRLVSNDDAWQILAP